MHIFHILKKHAQFYFFRQKSGNSFSTIVCLCFQKNVLMLYSINWLHLLLEILGKICIATTCFPGCDAINVWIKFIFLINPFFYMMKNSKQKLNIWRTKRAFKVQRKAFFIIFKGFLVAKNGLRPESVPFKSAIPFFQSHWETY